MSASARIAVLSPELADQIAAGEVVERPASVVKELVENAIDAGATRVEVELEGGGLESIRVVDDGVGIHPEDLNLAVTRHATSKVRAPGDLVEIATLGFRGEALASMAAVATVRLRSRRADAETGHELVSMPGQPPRVLPIGMPPGTQVEIQALFANVPARRKFLRAESTEAAHCSDTVQRISLVEPGVSLVLRNGGRSMLDFPAGTEDARMEQVLGRRAGGTPLAVAGEHDGIGVRAWIAPPESATRARGGVYVVVRRRVVRERNIARIVATALGPRLADGYHPVACVRIDPPGADVDVNVHPQKSEVRFRSPQLIYAAVREVLASELAGASWPEDAGSDPRAHAEPSSSSYRLATRALDADYRSQKSELRDAAREKSTPPRGAAVPPVVQTTIGPELLGVLPGPVALFSDGERLWAVNLLRLRAHLVHRRLARALGTHGVGAQGLLSPVVVRRTATDMEAVAGQREALLQLGIDAEPFGDDTILVRAVPADLSGCVEEADVHDLIDRVMPWLRLHARGEASLDEALPRIADTRGLDPAPRLGKRWLRELLESGGDLESVPGVRAWTASALTAEES